MKDTRNESPWIFDNEWIDPYGPEGTRAPEVMIEISLTIAETIPGNQQGAPPIAIYLKHGVPVALAT